MVFTEVFARWAFATFFNANYFRSSSRVSTNKTEMTWMNRAENIKNLNVFYLFFHVKKITFHDFNNSFL